MQTPNTRRTLVGLATLAAIHASSAFAAALDKNDRDFFEAAAVTGQFEIRSSELALTRASDPDARSFAQTMVREHKQLADKLGSLASSKGVKLPTALDPEHAQQLDKLRSAKSPKEFDETYADLMEDSHDNAVKLFKDAADKAKDPQLRAFAKNNVAALEQHSAAAEKLDAKDVSP